MHRRRTLFLHYVLYASDIQRNMVLVLSLGYILNFHDLVKELYLGKTYFGLGFILDGFMVLDIGNYVSSNTINNYYSLMTTSRNIYDNVVIWHARVGHIGQERMNRLARENLLGQFTKIDRLTFEYYLASKRTRKKIGKGTRTKNPLQIINFDIYGSIRVRARHEAFYFITFIDNFTCYSYVYLISHMLEALYFFLFFLHY